MRPGFYLITAIDNAYSVFGAYERPTTLTASPTRDASAILATLSSAPLRQLTGGQIGPYSGWALTTVGSVQDYKHFLPRILEQSVVSPLWIGTAPQIIAERLKRADWRSWPPIEQAAITTVFFTAFRQARDGHPDEERSTPDWLCGLAALEEDIQPLLAEWITEPQQNSLLQLADLVMRAPALMGNDDQELAYWSYVASDVRMGLASRLISSEVDGVLAQASDVENVDAWRLQQARALIASLSGKGRH